METKEQDKIAEGNNKSGIDFDGAKISICFTTDPSLHITIVTKDDYKVYYEVFYSSDPIKTAFSIYKNKELIARNIGEPEEMFGDINNVFKSLRHSQKKA